VVVMEVLVIRRKLVRCIGNLEKDNLVFSWSSYSVGGYVFCNNVYFAMGCIFQLVHSWTNRSLQSPSSLL
jgi:hypothetical protein